ncbi:hypothetical protein EPUS_04107 [Endocarpon pusillum Z07020]|uniref:PH domain-containing protein n=1 Tax=Endocarpon pusillum (strain Z07020 / HMAS-L-300199) TaxID=1263415 RepID=U1HVT5_ENDPU|nr:uncharacterized protein EPUS_04107 [Endocarpon pusillum Z07020]ERF73484.1 hypothetical protein EPUS_04107 [Endocarpon pusillum Z07020]
MAAPALPTVMPPTTGAVGGTDSTPVPSTAPAAATTEPNPATDTITSVSDTAAAATQDETAGKGEAKLEGGPASEGILGYKGPGLIQSLRFSKRFFWFSDEAFKTDTLDAYLRAEKAEIAHPNAAWAHETGKGLLFFAKRAEDKAAPAGILNLAEVADVTKEGSNDFSFKLNGHKHVFQAASPAERSSWIAAIEAKAAEGKGLKEGILGSEGYQKHFEKYNKLGVGAATTGSSLPGLSKSKERKETSAPPRKSLETKVKETLKKDKKDRVDTSSASSSDAEKKDKKSKSRSQSRKRASIFGLLGNKKEEQEEKKDVKKEEKAEEKAEKEMAKEHHKHDKEVAKEEKKQEKEIVKEHHKEEKKHEKEVTKEEQKLEKEQKQAEAQATHQPSDIAEAGAATVAATVAAAAPAAITTSHEKKADETKPELSTTRGTENLEKNRGKRGSIFGNFFGGRKDITSPTAEKTPTDGALVIPTKDSEVAPVSETAPKIDEPAQSKPIDAAAVTAPVDSAIAAHDVPANSVHAQTTTGAPIKSPTTPSHKGGVMGFFKRQDSKLEQKKEATADEPVSTATALETGVTSESPAAATSESKPTLKEKRRTSLFNTLASKKEKSESEVTEGETRKSPLPQKLGGLFRKPSKAVKSEQTQTEPTSAITESAPIAESTEGDAVSSAKAEPALTNGITQAPTEPVDRAPEAASGATPTVKASA